MLVEWLGALPACSHQRAVFKHHVLPCLTAGPDSPSPDSSTPQPMSPDTRRCQSVRESALGSRFLARGGSALVLAPPSRYFGRCLCPKRGEPPAPLGSLRTPSHLSLQAQAGSFCQRRAGHGCSCAGSRLWGAVRGGLQSLEGSPLHPAEPRKRDCVCPAAAWMSFFLFVSGAGSASAEPPT